MMRSMFSGVSSIKTHQVRMDVIGNNIANVNTAGFKADRATFQEVFQQTIRGATAPAGGRGGVNPVQVGLGVSLASIDTLHTETAIETTGVGTDLAIEGSGFFVVNDGERNFYTRAGLFDLDRDGYLVMRGNGYVVQGWERVGAGGDPGPINLYRQRSVPPKATENFYLGGNLYADTPATAPGDPAHIVVEGTVLDSLGRVHRVEIEFHKDGAAENTWRWAATTSGFSGTGTLEFDASGNLVLVDGDTITYEPGGGAADMEITLNFSAVTQYAEPTSVEALGHDGMLAGDLETFTIDGAGVIRGVYSNGTTAELGQIALARFNNPGGLSKVGYTLFETSANSGDPVIGRPGEQGRGVIAAGALEMSNVDLSQEFTNMILTQRGFQAGSRLITTSDEMLQELVNLKR